MKILVIGHGGHGKDTASEIIARRTGLRAISSSMFACEKAVYPALKEKYSYTSPQECYQDRRNHRIEWRDLIREYNAEDKARLTNELLAVADIYTGLRCNLEYQATKHLYDYIIWVSAMYRVGAFDPSFTIRFDESEMKKITNDGDENNLECELLDYFFPIRLCK